jgi:hypothetical protein
MLLKRARVSRERLFLNILGELIFDFDKHRPLKAIKT